MPNRKRSFLAVLAAVSVALFGFGCSGDLPTSPAASVAVVPSDGGNGTVSAQSNGTLCVSISVSNDDSGYSTPGAHQVGHFLVDNDPTQHRVGNEFDYAWWDSKCISLSPGPHTVTLVNDYLYTHAIVTDPPSTVGNVTISSGQTVYQGASFDDCTYLVCM